MATNKTQTQYVTIPLEEYKELLLSTTSATDRDKAVLERILYVISTHLRYSDSKYSSGYVGNNMMVEDTYDAFKEIMNILRYGDFERYMKMWNAVQTDERNKQAMQAKIDQMNKAKEMREDNA